MSSAVISACGRYRYELERGTGVVTDSHAVLFVMLNPSTADATSNDATVRRCLGYARAWGYGRLLVGNLYAYRATNPRELAGVADPVGPENDTHLSALADRADLIVCAWGRRGPQPTRVQHVRYLLGGPLYFLARTKAGEPRHPLRLRASLTPAVLA